MAECLSLVFCIMYVANKREKAELICVLLLFEKG